MFSPLQSSFTLLSSNSAKCCRLFTVSYVSFDDEKEDCGYKRIVRPAELALPAVKHVDAITHGIKGGKLEVLPRVDFDELFG